MGTLTHGASRTLDPQTSEAISNAISSQGSEAGRWPFVLPDGRMIGPSGLALALASLSARQARELGLQTSGISGRPGSISSRSAALQQSLASKLQARLPLRGLTLFKMTWKVRTTPAGRPICALRASALFTSGSGCGGLPTPSGTSNHGKNHVAGRLDEWGGSSNPFRGTPRGPVHCPAFEFWAMGYPDAWPEQMPPAMPSSRRSLPNSSKPQEPSHD